MILQRILCAILFSACILPAFAEPTNIAFVKAELKRYHDEGRYQHEVALVIKKAKLYLAKKIAAPSEQTAPKKLAIVFDIDETTLSNYQDMEKMNFGGSLKEIDKNIAKGDAPALSPSLELYQFALAHHVAVFFVTGRHPNVKQSTIQNLHQAGYHHWSGLYFKPTQYHEPSVIPYKSQTRRKITEKGYEIVESLGDQMSDLRGGYAEATFKLPNPYYFIP